MKVLMFSTDSSILESGSPAQERMIEYGSLVEKLFIVVLSKKRVKSRVLDVNQNIRVFSAYFWCAWNLGRKFENQGINLVTAQDPFETGLIGYRAARRLKARLQLQIHTDFLSPYFVKGSLKNRVRVWIAKWFLPKANSIRVVSERIKKSLIDLGLPEKKIVVLPIFVDAKEKSIGIDLHEEYPQFDFIILMASRLEKEKNIELAIDAMQDIKIKNSKAGLVIAGDGSLKEELQKRVLKNELDKNIVFEGWVKNLSSYYETADCLLANSSYEGYGRSIIMTSVANTAIVTTDVGVVGEILNKDNCIIIPIGDKQALADAILKLMSDKPLREEIAERARSAVLSSLISKEEYLQKYKQSWEMAL